MNYHGNSLDMSSPRLLQRMRRRFSSRIAPLFAIQFLIISALPLISTANQQSSGLPAQSPRKAGLEFVPGEALVRFRSDSEAVQTKPAESRTLSVQGREVRITVENLGRSDLVEGLRLVRFPQEDTLSVIASLNGRADVAYAEPNYIRRAYKAPNDGRYQDQWGLKNTGQPNQYGNPGVPGDDIHAEQAWDITTGSRNIVVGVIDEGIDINHEDLKDNIWTNPAENAGDGVDDDGNGYTDDIHGWNFYDNNNRVFAGAGNYPTDQTDAHGTHVAGIIGASGNNTTGVSGVNWQVSLMSLKFLGPNGGKSSDALRAYGYAKTMRDLWTSSGGKKGANVRVLNNSYGGAGFSQAEQDAIRALGGSGILFVVAAGNDSRNNDQFPEYPSSYVAANLISVAASTRSDLPASFTNWGPASVSMAAPGDGILSTTPNNTYDFYSGTSMATPMVSGAAALICSAFPDVSVRRLRAALLYSGDLMTGVSFSSNLASGRRLNVYRALQNVALSDTMPPGQIGNFRRLNSFDYPKIPLAWIDTGDDGTTGQAAVTEIRFSDYDLSNPADFELARPLAAPLPGASGAFNQATVEIPWRHPSGFIGIRAVDKAGNAGAISVIPVSQSADIADPYLISESSATALSTGGTALNLIGDDASKIYSLPFNFPFFAAQTLQSSVTVSSNGALYFGSLVGSNQTGPGHDSESSVSTLCGYPMIAGAWDDLRTDRRPGDDVYVVQPDADHVIFRWQAVTYDTPVSASQTRGENPVNFEIELARDGTIQIRYGDGNHNLAPVVGVAGGWPDPYVIASHTAGDSLIDLTAAPTVTLARRPAPPPPANVGIAGLNPTPYPVTSGQQITYRVDVNNTGPAVSTNSVTKVTLPSGTRFVSCTTDSGTCTGPPPGADGGIVTIQRNTLPVGTYSTSVITADVTAAGGANLTVTATISGAESDQTPSNNSATATTPVMFGIPFDGVEAISAGYTSTYTLALRDNGEVWGWGGNYEGTLGDRSNTPRWYPVKVSSLLDIRGISAGGFHAVALKNDGTV